MNEYDNILNRIVEEFYDTGKVVLNESIVGGPAIDVNNAIGMGDQAIGNSQFKEAKNHYNKALSLFNDLKDGMKVFLNPPNMNVEFIENKIMDSEKRLWDSDYKKAKKIEVNKNYQEVINFYSKMLGYYESLNDKVKEELSKEKTEVEGKKETLRSIISREETSDRVIKSTQEKIERKREIENQNQEPLPLLSRETEIGDNDMFLRNLQNILIQYQNQRFDEEENVDTLETLYRIKKDRDESLYGDTTEELVRNYQIENRLNATGEVDEETWESILSMEKRLDRYSNRISKFSVDKKNIVSPEEYEELIRQDEDVSMLKKLLSQNLGNFLYHIQDKDIYAHTSFKKKDYEEKYEEDKEKYKSTPLDAYGKVKYPNLDAKYKTKIDKIEKEIENLENSPISINNPTYNKIVQQYRIDLTGDSKKEFEKIPKKLRRLFEKRWFYIDEKEKELKKELEDKEEDIQKAKKFNDEYVVDTTNEDWLKRKKDKYVTDKIDASRQSSTIVGLFKKLFKSIEEGELVGETPLKDINNAISEINKTLKYEFKKEVSDSRKNKIKGAIKKVIEAIQEGDVDNTTIDEILKLKTLAWGEYENGFIEDKGEFFDKGENRNIEGRIHNLDKNYLSDEIKSDTDSNTIKNNIKDNITNYLLRYEDDSGDSVERDIVKHDLKIKGDKEIKDSDGTVILSGSSKVEVKSQSYTIDSYYSEPLASPMKKTSDEIRKNIDLRNKYNEIIDGLYNWVNNTTEGISYGETLIRKMVSGTEGILFSDDIYVPIEEIEFYISNKGQNSCDNHRRLTIRYRVKRNKNINVYKLKKNDNTNNWEFEKGETEIVRTGDKLNLKYCGGEDNTPNVKYNMDDNTLDEIVENFFDTGKFVI